MGDSSCFQDSAPENENNPYPAVAQRHQNNQPKVKGKVKFRNEKFPVPAVFLFIRSSVTDNLERRYTGFLYKNKIKRQKEYLVVIIIKVKPSWACTTHSSFPEHSTHHLWASECR